MTCAVNGSEKSALGPRELCKAPHAAEQDGFFFFTESSHQWERSPSHSTGLIISGSPCQLRPFSFSSCPWLLCLLPFLYLTLRYIRSMVAIIRLFLLSMTGPPSWSRDCLDAVARTVGWVEQHRRSKVYGDGNRAIDPP